MISTREWHVIHWTIFVGTAMQLGWYLTWERFVHTEKQRAYVLCLLSSTIMTLGALPYFYHLMQTGLDGVLQHHQEAAVALTTFFLTFLVWDLVVGVCRYRSKIDPLTGWVHHTAYFCMLMWVLQQQYAPLFMALCVMELPTFFLSVGSIHTPWRHDYLFAATFVATRIVFHGSCLVGAVRTFGISSSITLSLTAVLPVHIYWFVGKVEGGNVESN
jgi:hypothetical protein